LRLRSVTTGKEPRTDKEGKVHYDNIKDHLLVCDAISRHRFDFDPTLIAEPRQR